MGNNESNVFFRKRSPTQRQALFNQIGSLYFKKYLEEQFCVENFLFHQAICKYKTAKSTQRIKIGQEIIHQFVEIGSEKEVNLSYQTRKQILTIVNLVKKMNDNKAKYHQLLSRKDHLLSMNEEDIKNLKNGQKN